MSDGGFGLSGSFDHPDEDAQGQEPAAGVLTANRAGELQRRGAKDQRTRCKT